MTIFVIVERFKNHIIESQQIDFFPVHIISVYTKFFYSLVVLSSAPTKLEITLFYGDTLSHAC